MIKKAIWDMTKHGILRFGLQLTIVEITTISSILLLKTIISMLSSPGEYSMPYKVLIFVLFTVLRLIAIFARSYYDLDVYNYFRYV